MNCKRQTPAPFRKRHGLLILGWIALAGLAACQRNLAPAAAIDEARRLLDAGQATAAVTLLTDTVRAHPADAALRAELGRAQLAAGEVAAAEGSLRRAIDLGASTDQVLVPLAESLLGQDNPGAAAHLIGEPSRHPPALRVPLEVLAAEARLRLDGSDQRDVTRSFVAAFRLAADPGLAASSDRDVRSAARRLERLQAEHEWVQFAHEHYACQAEAATAGSAGATRSPDAEVVAGRRVLQVGPTRALKTPSAAAIEAHDGDVIAIDAGDYPGDVAVWRQNELLLKGVGGRVRLDARGRSAANQGTWVFRGNDITVEGVEFSGARAPHRNGSGIRFLGRNLTVRDSVFRDNEAGVLTWHDPQSDVVIEHSVFERNGFGDGLSHNIYIGRVRSFSLRFSYSHDSHVGHEVKSRARINHILYNRLTDEDDGDSSYLVDLPEGGDAYVVGNLLLKGARAENPHAISYAAEQPAVSDGQLWVANNSLWNRYPYAVFVRNASRRPATLANNLVAGAPVLLLKGPGREITNYAAQRPGLREPGQLDFTLTADSPLIDAGTDLSTVGGQQLVAAFEYAHPALGRGRPRVGPIDIGATEFCGW